MVRQFEIQLGEIQQLLHRQQNQQTQQLMDENKRLRDEIRQLRKLY